MSSHIQLQKFVHCGKKIVAVGRNYVAHAKELNNPIPKEPLIFMKPTSSYITAGQEIEIPPDATELHHEVELGLIVGKKCKNLTEDQVDDIIGGYVLALDMTNRNKQIQLKEKGHPWELAKAFDTSCPVGEFISKDQIPDPQSIRLWLKVNGEMRQDSKTDDMIFKIPFLVSFVSKYFTLEPGDLILTGTPAGVGPVKAGDSIEAGIGDLVTINFNVQK